MKLSVIVDQIAERKQVHPKSHNSQNETCRSTPYFGEKINSFVLVIFTLKACFPQFKQLNHMIVSPEN
jgi:hypothetical protein